MVKDNINRSSVVETLHRCGRSCLGPLTFHPQAVGNKIILSHGCRLAKRVEGTFKNGLVFSNRTVKIHERIRFRVETNLCNWHGALRVGFTTVPPTARSQPLPVMAIPNLTDTRGHWASPVPEYLCQAGSVLEFWVSYGGSIHISINNMIQEKLYTGVDLSRPLWAMIDVYGQTSSILLLGSEKRGLFNTRKSCPAPEYVTPPDDDNSFSLIPHLDVHEDDGSVTECVACMAKAAKVTLPCGHRCLCYQCAAMVCQQIGTCPLCRRSITGPSVQHVSITH